MILNRIINQGFSEDPEDLRKKQDNILISRRYTSEGNYGSSFYY